jgi:hypothetical protein
LQDFTVVRVNGEAAGTDTVYLYPSASDTVRERSDDWLMSGDGYSITVERAFSAVEVHDYSGPGSQNAMAGPDEFSPQALPGRDLADLAHGLPHEGGTSNDMEDEEEAAIDLVLRTDFWWDMASPAGKR